jgi:RNA polymerase sigma-54 factor
MTNSVDANHASLDPIKLAIVVIEKYFEEFTRKHYDKIQKSLHLNEIEIKGVLQQILNLNPRPGADTHESHTSEMYIIPDFTVVINNGIVELSLNNRNAPPLIISDDYKMMLKEYERGKKQDKSQKEAVFFIKQKIDAAKWFIEMIQQRQQTLLKTMKAILAHQQNFFTTGDTTQLRPMILKDIAAATNTFNEFGKRVELVEQDTAFRKSGDLGEIVQNQPETVEKSLWGGSFLKTADLFN